MLQYSPVIGIPVLAVPFAEAAGAVFQRGKARAGGYVCVANVHMLVTARREPDFRRVMESAALTVCDGMPLVWENRRRGVSGAERCAGPDLTVTLLEAAQRENLGVCFYGGSEPGNRDLLEWIHGRFPRLKASAIAAPMLPQKPPRDPEALRRIRETEASIVFAGIGCPKQEFWMAANSDVPGPVFVGVGAAFDFLSGSKSRAPVWMQKAGLEWLFRLGSEPGRLWRRYLTTNTLFVWYWLTELFSGSGRSRRAA